MPDPATERIQYIYKDRTRSDGKTVYRIAPWQYVDYQGTYGQGARGLEPVDIRFPGVNVLGDKEITGFAFINDGDLAPGVASSGGHVGFPKST